MSNLEDEVKRQLAEMRRKEAEGEAAREHFRQERTAQEKEAARLQQEAANKVAEEAQGKKLALEAEEARLLKMLRDKGVKQELQKVKDELWGGRGKIIESTSSREEVINNVESSRRQISGASISLVFEYKEIEGYWKYIKEPTYRTELGQAYGVNSHKLDEGIRVYLPRTIPQKISLSVSTSTHPGQNGIASVSSFDYGDIDFYHGASRNIPLDLPTHEFRARLEQMFAYMHADAVMSKRTPQDKGIFRRLFR